MSGQRKTNAWAGRTVRICPSATTGSGRAHPHAGARGLVLDVPPSSGCYSVRLVDGGVANVAGSALLLDGPGDTIGQWPGLHERLRSHSAAPAYARAALPIANATSRARYDGAELRASLRPGATDNARLPSRVGNRLYHPCGRVTDLQGNPITQEQPA